MIIESPNFGGHFVNDRCPSTFNIGSISGFFKSAMVGRADKIGLTEKVAMVKRYGPLGLRAPLIARDARRLLSEFILRGGTQEEALNVLLPPSVFDPDNYPLDTIVRITVPYHAFVPERRVLSILGNRSKNSYSLSTSLQILGENHISCVSTTLGVITSSPTGKERIIVDFLNREEDILNNRASSTFSIGPERLGEWRHFGLYGLVLRGEESFFDEFKNLGKVEILELGKREAEKVTPQVQNLAFSSR